MHPRKDAPVDQIDMPGLYSIGRLAQLYGVSRHVMLRLLREGGVRFVRSGRAMYVPLTELQERIPALWKTLQYLLKREAARGEPPERRSAGRQRLYRPSGR